MRAELSHEALRLDGNERTAYKIGFKIKEVPVVFVNRREGVSKMSGSIFGEAFFGVMQLRLDGWLRKYPTPKA